MSKKMAIILSIVLFIILVVLIVFEKSAPTAGSDFLYGLFE